MQASKITLHRDYQIAPVDPRLFGGFLEHIGRAVYEGVYEPQSRHADDHGFRTDVLSSLERLAFTAMRYPGGNFASVINGRAVRSSDGVHFSPEGGALVGALARTWVRSASVGQQSTLRLFAFW